MIQITFFIECMSLEESQNIALYALKNGNSIINEVKVKSNEEYEKFENWYRITCDIMTNRIIDLDMANEFLIKISDKWNWNGGNTSSHSCSRTMNAKFIEDKIKFITCWFEDLETLRNKNIKE